MSDSENQPKENTKKDLTSFIEWSTSEQPVVFDSSQEQAAGNDFLNLDIGDPSSSPVPSEQSQAPIQKTEPTADPEPLPEIQPEVLEPSASPEIFENKNAPEDIFANDIANDIPNSEPTRATAITPSPEPTKPNLDSVKSFGEKIIIGKPKIDANPPFSMLITNKSKKFSDDLKKELQTILENEDLGIQFNDLVIQFETGKILLPQISEYAAVFIAQRIRDLVDNIELDLASEIFKSDSLADEPTEQIFNDAEMLEARTEEVHDIGAEPTKESDLFSTNLGEIAGFQVTRVLSIISHSEVISATIAENQHSQDFENLSDKLTKILIKKAFDLGAHGILGISYSLKPLESGMDKGSGVIDRAYRVLATGTAVRARRKK